MQLLENGVGTMRVNMCGTDQVMHIPSKGCAEIFGTS